MNREWKVFECLDLDLEKTLNEIDQAKGYIYQILAIESKDLMANTEIEEEEEIVYKERVVKWKIIAFKVIPKNREYLKTYEDVKRNFSQRRNG